MANLVTALNSLATAAGLAGTFSSENAAADLHFTYTANGASSAVTSTLGVKLTVRVLLGKLYLLLEQLLLKTQASLQLRVLLRLIRSPALVQL